MAKAVSGSDSISTVESDTNRTSRKHLAQVLALLSISDSEVNQRTSGAERNGSNSEKSEFLRLVALTCRIAQRAILDKRYADAAGRTSAARAEFMVKVSEDHLLSLLYFTDAVMLFLYSYWCSEQASGKTRPQDFVTSDRLREQVLHTWERETRKEDATDDEKTRAKGMVGLM